LRAIFAAMPAPALDLGRSLDVALPLIELTRKTDRVVTGLQPA
jgi:hypothetical protein